jgi:hypothetical protein
VDASLAEGGMRRETGAHGWSVDVEFPIARHVSLVGSADGSYGRETRTVSTFVFGGGTLTNSWTDMAYLAGTRFRLGSGRRVSPFLQTLAGLMTTRQKDVYETVRDSGGPYENYESFFVLVPGGGVDIDLSRRFGVRLSGDVPIHLLNLIFQGDDTTLSRLVAGLVMRFP